MVFIILTGNTCGISWAFRGEQLVTGAAQDLCDVYEGIAG